MEEQEAEEEAQQTSTLQNIAASLTMISRISMEKKEAFERFREMAKKAMEERKNHPNEEALSRFKELMERIKKAKEEKV